MLRGRVLSNVRVSFNVPSSFPRVSVLCTCACAHVAGNAIQTKRMGLTGFASTLFTFFSATC